MQATSSLVKMQRRSGDQLPPNPTPLPELTRRDKRVAILVQFRLGKSASDCLADLKSALGEQAPLKTMVYKYYQRFQCGHYDLEDDIREGRPILHSTQETIDLLKEKLDEDRRITIRELQHTLGISYGTIHSLLHTQLDMRKLCARWVPHQLSPGHLESRLEFCHFMLEKFDGGESEYVSNILTGDETWIYFYDPETKQQSRQWVADGEDVPVKFMREKSTGKVMIAVFFRRTGILRPVELEKGATVNANWYVNTCLTQILAQIHESRPGTGAKNLFLHHGNASSHTAKITKEFINTSDFHQLPHSPYSPDLAPCDYFLFPKIKRELKGKHFQSREELMQALDVELKKVTSADLHQCFSAWFSRMHKCIKQSGGYFEKI